MKELDCPNCGKKVQIPEQGLESVIACMHCGVTLKLRLAVRSSAPPSPIFFRVSVLAVTCILLSAAAGMVVNAVDVRISPAFFHFALPNIVEIQRAAIAFGLCIGLLFGLLAASVYTGVVYLVSKGKFELLQAIHTLLAYSLLAPVGYFLGGCAGTALASLSPEFYRLAFIRGMPLSGEETFLFSWAGGGFVGVVCGGIAAVSGACIHYAVCWCRQHPV